MTTAAFSTRDLFAWLEQVRADHALPARAFVTAFTIGGHVSRATGLAWPRQDSIAAITGLTERTIGSMVSALAEAGHLELGTRTGIGGGFRRTYRPLLKGRSKNEKAFRSGAATKTENLTDLPGLTKTENSREQNGKSTSSHIDEPSQEPLESVTRDRAGDRRGLQARGSLTMAVSR